MRKYSIWVPQFQLKTTESGPTGENVTPILRDCLCNVPSSHRVSWFPLGFATEAKELHFVDDKAKINAQYYVNTLLPKLIEDCITLKPDNFIFQQDNAPAHRSHLAQDWLSKYVPDFIASVEWPPNSPDLNPLDFHVWRATLHGYQEHVPKPKETNINWRQC